MNNSKGLIFATMGINMALGIADRVAQICYVAMTSFLTSTIEKTAITFCVLPTAIHFFMILIYVIFHNEEMHTTRFKIKIFFMYLFSTEALFPIGVHRSFKSKFSDNSDNPWVSGVSYPERNGRNIWATFRQNWTAAPE